MMQTFTIYHNPRCSKSRTALALLQANSVTPQIRTYIDQPLSAHELTSLLAQLALPASAVIRHKEALYGEWGLSAASDENTLRAALLTHPQLLERPIVSNGNKAVIARPAEALLELFANSLHTPSHAMSDAR